MHHLGDWYPRTLPRGQGTRSRDPFQHLVNNV